MPNPADLLPEIPATALWIAAGIVAAALTLYGLWHLKRLAGTRPLEESLTVVAAAIATGVSAQGMWRFTGDVLGFDGPLRVLLFAFIELAVIASAVRARRSMRDNYSAGIDGIAVWVLTVLTAVLSAMDARSPAEAVFRLAAPLVAAWLWERGMAVERRRVSGLSGINWRLTPERILVRLGLAEARDRTADEVDAHRRLTRVALAAVRARELAEASKPGKATRRQARAHARLRTALERAEEHTDLATNPATQSTLLDKALILRSGTGLTQLPDVLPWATLDHPAVTATRQVALTGGATQKVADTATDTTPAPTPVAVTPAEPTDTGTGSGSATTATDITPVAGRYQWRHRHPGPAETATDTSTAATGSATATDIFSDTATDTAPPVAPPARHRHPAQNATTTDTATQAATTPEPATPDTDTGDDTLTATASATDTMWHHWQRALQEGHDLSGAELARLAGCAPSYGRRMKKLWLTDTQQQPLAPITGPVNGHHAGGAA